jgi:probable phosphoglycerate mutase
MVKTIHLIRHGHHALLGHRMCGRMPGLALDELGCRQMQRCAELLAPSPTAIQSSPQRRARQSAEILASRFGLAVEVVPALDEIDLGDWTGRNFAELEIDPDWARWNTDRGNSRPPSGESARSLQQRVVRHLEQLRHGDSDDTLAIVSHAETIRVALLHYAGLSLDDFLSIELDPASVSTLLVDRTVVHIASVNQEVPA